MSLEYYLLCRETTNEVIINLTNVINGMSVLYSNTISEETKDNSNLYRNPFFINYINHKEAIQSQIKNMENCKTWCENNIDKLCTHEFIVDMIDINPDKSKTICYCKICGHTEK